MKILLLYALSLPVLLTAQSTVPPTLQWEVQLKQRPDNIELRSNLIREYFRLSRQDASAEKARVAHVLWMVEHRPEAPILADPAATVGHAGADYDALKTVWLAQSSAAGVSPQTLANAAIFFRPMELPRSVELLSRARSLEPKNQTWTFMLGEMYAFQIVGVPELNQNGLPLSVDPSKVDARQAEQTEAMLLASKDVELLQVVAGALQGRASIAAMISGKKAEAAAVTEKLFKRVQALEPGNAFPHSALAEFYSRQSDYTTGDVRSGLVHKAMAEYNVATGIDASAASAIPPWRYARTAVEAGELDKAQSAAEKCLSQAPSLRIKDTAVHECNLILGRVALRRGELKAAGEYLLAAARIHGDGALTSFGPNMMLAQELLEQGQRDVVLEYFRLCDKFWPGQIELWTRQVNAGEIPQFGANLVY